jgi:hypothetical protein
VTVIAHSTVPAARGAVSVGSGLGLHATFVAGTAPLRTMISLTDAACDGGESRAPKPIAENKKNVFFTGAAF